MPDIDVTGYDNPATPGTDEGTTDVNGLIVSHPNGGVVSGTGGFQPFLRQNNNDGTTTGFNTSDADTLADAGDEALDMDATWTRAIRFGDLPIVMRNGIAYYEIRLDLNEPNNSNLDSGGDPNPLLELSEFQLYWSHQQATLADYTAGDGLVLDSDFHNVYDLDSGGVDRSLILADGPSGSGNDDYAFLIPVSAFDDAGPDDYLTLFAQFGPQPQEGATFEEFRLQNAFRITGTKYLDVNGDGARDVNGVDNILGNGDDEVGLAGFTMYIDANHNNVLDLGEVTAESGTNGAFAFYNLLAGTYDVREVLTGDDVSAAVKAANPDWEDYLPPAGFWDQTTGNLDGDHVVTITTASQLALVGNHELTPAITISKAAVLHDGGECVDEDGDVVDYTVLVTNTGNTVLSNVVVTDSFEGGSDVTISGPASGDANSNGLLDPGETWTYTYTYTATQDDIDSNGGDDDGTLDNVATVNADSAATDSSVTDNDDASVEVCPAPGIAIDKVAALDDDGDCVDEDGDIINYTYSVTNTGNVALDNVVVVDDKVTVVADDGDSDGFNDGDLDEDGLLDVNETWTYSASYTATQADIDSAGDGDGFIHNTVTANGDAAVSGEAAPEASDSEAVEVCQNPHITVAKDATVDGDCADTAGELVNYSISVTNDGNVTLDTVVVTDTLADSGSVQAVDLDSSGFNDGDLDEDGNLDVGETWLYTAYHTVTQDEIDAGGNYDSSDPADGTNDSLRNVATASAEVVNSDTQVTDDDDAVVEVCQNPHITVAKDATVDGDCADTAGELVNYSISVTNDGNVTLDTVVVTDTLADSGSVQAVDLDSSGFNDGDLDEDGNLDVGETWLYTAYHTVTQDEIDAGGNYDSSDPADGTNDSLRNVATATAEVVNSDAQVTDDDDAVVEVCQLPGIDIEKYVMTDVSGAFVDADDPDGPAAGTSSDVDFKVVLTNDGNVTLTEVTLSDSVVHTVGGVAQAPVDIDYAAAGAFLDVINVNGVLDPGEAWINFDTNNDGTLDIDENGDPFELSVGESVTIYYSLTSQLGQHENTVEVTTAEGAGDDDDANYFVLASDDCVGVRTPGFWSNPKWMTFWDAKGDGWGTAPNEPTQAGTPGFADGELLYKVYLTDSNHDGVINGNPNDGIADDAFSTGLLIGDYNMNGITDAGEDTIFVSLPDAIKLINASSKQLVEGKGTADGIFMLGRDMVATWLNYLANNQGEGDNGNCIGTVDGATNSPREFLDAAIDWMQQFASTSNSDDTASHTDSNTNTSFHDGNTQATFEFDPRVNPSSASWQAAFTTGEDIPVSAAAMHSALDAYNNTGAINGVEYCCDADSEIALVAIAQLI